MTEVLLFTGVRYERLGSANPNIFSAGLPSAEIVPLNALPVPPAAKGPCFDQTNRGYEQRNQRDALNAWVKEQVKAMALPQLPSRTEADYERCRSDGKTNLKRILKPRYQGTASDLDWEIAITNAMNG